MEDNSIIEGGVCMNCNEKVCVCNPYFYNSINTIDKLDKFSKYGGLLKEMFESGNNQLLLQKSAMKLVNEIVNNGGSGDAEADDELSGQLIKGKQKYGEDFEKEFWKQLNNSNKSGDKNKMTEDLQKENVMLKKELEECRYENTCLKMKLEDYGYENNQSVKTPPYVMSKLLDGLHIDSYQYVGDSIDEENIEENYIDDDEEITINI